MNKKELCEAVSIKTGENIEACEKIIEEMLCSIENELKDRGEVKLFGFGKFYTRKYNKRNCYNPITKKIEILNESVQPCFKAGPKFREKIQ